MSVMATWLGVDADDVVQGPHPGHEGIEPDGLAPGVAQRGDLFLEDLADLWGLGLEHLLPGVSARSRPARL